MARYIDVDKVELKGLAVFDENLDVLVPLSVVRKALQMTPTADVVPRAKAVREVFKAFGVLIPENTTLEEAVESYKKTQKIIRNMAIANAKAEVAREIFEDIREKGKFNEPIVDYVCLSFEELSEIEKKYTGDQT